MSSRLKISKTENALAPRTRRNRICNESSSYQMILSNPEWDTILQGGRASCSLFLERHRKFPIDWDTPVHFFFAPCCLVTRYGSNKSFTKRSDEMFRFWFANIWSGRRHRAPWGKGVIPFVNRNAPVRRASQISQRRWRFLPYPQLRYRLRSVLIDYVTP